MSCINSARKWVASHKDGRLTVARAGTLHALDQEIQCADDEPELGLLHAAQRRIGLTEHHEHSRAEVHKIDGGGVVGLVAE